MGVRPKRSVEAPSRRKATATAGAEGVASALTPVAVTVIAETKMPAIRKTGPHRCRESWSWQPSAKDRRPEEHGGHQSHARRTREPPSMAHVCAISGASPMPRPLAPAPPLQTIMLDELKVFAYLHREENMDACVAFRHGAIIT